MSLFTAPRMITILVGLFSVLEAFAAASDPTVTLNDPALEARAKAITRQLRCPTCVSQSVADSGVGVSQDIDKLVRERLLLGETDQEIFDYVAARYGDYVLLKPRTQGVNLILWVLPFLMLTGAVAAIVIALRKRRSDAAGQTLSPDEQARLQKLQRDL